MKRGVNTNKSNKKINWPVLIISFISVAITAFIGSLFTSTEVNSVWYNSIKPSITPPSWVFPIAWTILYILVAFSIYYAWTSSKNIKQKKVIGILFAVNLYFNILWSIIYFGQQNIKLALIDAIFIWISIAVLIVNTYKLSKKSAYLLIPYLIWVSFAIILNYLSIY
ncbi:tryptophan-rich sensory protein [Candidatus Pacearchaeota archaeon]|nr:tryptophan-rich sensory protein [Candidatus Pacearchaeota archaeon]